MFSPSLDDSGDRRGYKNIPDEYDYTKGTRSRDAIPYERGILVRINHHHRLIRIKNNSIKISPGQILQDGNSFTVWIKEEKEKRFVLHYDSGKPAVSSQELQKNVREDIMNFTSR